MRASACWERLPRIRSAVRRMCSSSGSKGGAPPPAIPSRLILPIDRAQSLGGRPTRRGAPATSTYDIGDRDEDLAEADEAADVSKRRFAKRELSRFGNWNSKRDKSYKFVREIGRGGFGKVILVQHVASGAYFTLKRVGAKDVYALSGEERLALQHPFIVRLLSSFNDNLDDGTVERILIFEYCKGPMLSVFLRRAPDYVRLHAPFFAAQLVLCLKHLDFARIVHRDVKPDNIILMGRTGAKATFLKLADFGLATRWSDSSPERKLCGTLQYMAPEMITQQPTGTAVDWWALGVIVHEMVTGFNPFADLDSQFDVMMKIAYQDFVFSPKALEALDSQGERGEAAKDLISRLLNRDPGKRTDFVKVIKSHEFFKDINWHRVLTHEERIPLPTGSSLETPMDAKDYTSMTTSIMIDMDKVEMGVPSHSSPEWDSLHPKDRSASGEGANG